MPDHTIAQALLGALGEPLMSSTLLLPNDPYPLTDPEDIRDRLEHQVDAIIDGGSCGIEPTSVLDLSGGEVDGRPKRQGRRHCIRRLTAPGDYV